ncbi:MAG: hypothetical protein K8R76_06100 [Candidatus Aegiribacteria sp.]|nr:hypothetical protein [Candidatus Aegiribacteria sp.]
MKAQLTTCFTGNITIYTFDCGQPGCPAGIGTAGLLGIIFALMTGKKLWLRSGKFHADNGKRAGR